MLITRIKNIRHQKGFTLIELLVVVTLIAILAVAVLAAINPIEQRRKGTDTQMRALAAEYINSQERYFATYGCYTWDSTTAGACDNIAEATAPDSNPADTDNDNTFLVTVGEAKQNLVDRVTNLPQGYTLTLTMDSQESLHISFSPQSDSFKALATANLDCSNPNATPAGSAFICVPDTTF